MKSAEISILITQGRAYKSGSFLFRVLNNKDILYSKPGFITPKKIFKTAVLRNRARRRLKSALYKTYKANNKVYFENKMIFMINKEALIVDFDELVDEIKNVFQKSAIINI